VGGAGERRRGGNPCAWLMLWVGGLVPLFPVLTPVSLLSLPSPLVSVSGDVGVLCCTPFLCPR
jgi:hypothetical protein